MAGEKKRIYVDGYLVNFSSGAGYPTIWVNGKNILVHRYVWERTYGEIPKGFHIHHVDGDRKNFSLENLALISASEHERQHAVKNGLGRSNKGKPKKHISGFCGKARAVIAIKDGVELRFESISACARALNMNVDSVCRVLSGKRKQNYKWSFMYGSS